VLAACQKDLNITAEHSFEVKRRCLRRMYISCHPNDERGGGSHAHGDGWDPAARNNCNLWVPARQPSHLNGLVPEIATGPFFSSRDQVPLAPQTNI
jgi:hypothetical protein